MLSVREILPTDIPSITNYWLQADAAYLKGMGADKSKLPTAEQWHQMLQTQINLPYSEKQSYCTIWEVNGEAVGHCNVNQISFGKEANMHLHLWHPETRQKGSGSELVKKSLFYFFQNLKLQTLFCEPYALKPAPNKTLEKVGFRFVKEYITTPGSINFEQLVNRWELTKEEFEKLS